VGDGLEGTTMMFDVLLWLVAVGLIALLVRIAYDLGLDDGWAESGRWADEHLGPVLLSAEDRPATRDG
jgi:hypothetical protein